jgi:hypothetical protein
MNSFNLSRDGWCQATTRMAAWKKLRAQKAQALSLIVDLLRNARSRAR